MCKLVQLIIIIQNILFVFSSRVTLMKNEYLSAPNSTNFKLKCDFHLDRNGQTVQRVDISKDNHIFYSVEYNKDNNMLHKHLGVPPHISPVTNFKKVSGIHELETNDTNIDSLRSSGWTSIFIKRTGTKSTPGTYRCKVHYLDGTKHKNIESDKIYIDDKKGNFEPLPLAQTMIHSIPENVKLKINHGHEKFHKNDNIKIECKYKLVKKDKFAGLSMTKDNQEFFRFYTKKNHSFVKVPGIDKISYASYSKKLYLTIKKAKNITAGTYGCLLDFTNPTSEERVMSLSDTSRILFKNSSDSKLAKTWILLLLFMIFVIY